MVNNGEKFRALRDKKNKYSNYALSFSEQLTEIFFQPVAKQRHHNYRNIS
jgi:hypothetical protein